jgi:hypothetical protein
MSEGLVMLHTRGRGILSGTACSMPVMLRTILEKLNVCESGYTRFQQ